MSIYPSSKVLPYVYQCVHKITGKIYIGSRTNKLQKLPSHLDLPNYRTSSKQVKPIFEEFYWHIVAEFFNRQDAYDFEQQMIHEQWLVSKEISLNRYHHYGKKSWNNKGGYNLTKETKLKMSKPKTQDHKFNIKNGQLGKPKSESHKQNMRKPKSKEHKRNKSKIIDVLTPDGVVIENTTMKELCSQFNLNYNSFNTGIRRNKHYKGFKIIQY